MQGAILSKSPVTQSSAVSNRGPKLSLEESWPGKLMRGGVVPGAAVSCRQRDCELITMGAPALMPYQQEHRLYMGTECQREVWTILPASQLCLARASATPLWGEHRSEPQITSYTLRAYC